MATLTHTVYNVLPEKIKGTALLRLFGFFKVPLLYWLRPSVIRMDDTTSVIKIKLNRKTKNHLNSMYFGVLAAGADCAGGLTAMKMITESGRDVSLVFKDFTAKFLKRPEGDTLFTCTQGKEVAELVAKCIESGERENLPLNIVATCPSKLGNEPVAEFVLTLSLKDKSHR